MDAGSVINLKCEFASYMKQLASHCATLCVAISVFSAGGTAQAQEKISVTREGCANLVGHHAQSDIAYKPGVDVNGKKVIPAEGDGPTPVQIELPKKIVIDFGVDLAGKYAISGAGDQTATAKLFAVEYDLGSGSLAINGKALNKDDSRAIAKACKTFLAQKGQKPQQKQAK